MKRLGLFFALLGLISSLYGVEWKTNLEKAQEEAKKTGKLIFVNFTGSDWCIWCIKLRKEVFEKELFQKEAPKMFVLVELDFPRRKPQSEEVKKYNRRLLEKYGVRGFPTILILNVEGDVLARTGYQAGGAKKYLEHLRKLVKLKDVEAIFKKISQEGYRPSEEDVTKLRGAMKILEETARYEQVSRRYHEAKVKALKAIMERDPENKKGWKLEASKRLARHYSESKEKKKELEEILAEIKKMDEKAWNDLSIELKEIPKILESLRKTRPTKEDFQKVANELEKLIERNPSKEVTQKIYYYLGAIYFRVLGDQKKGIDFLKKAYQAAPNTDFGRRIGQILKQLGSR